MGTNSAAAELGLHLARIGEQVGHSIAAQRDLARDHEVAEQTSHDTIFAIDRRIESVVVEALQDLPAHLLPASLVAEGVGDGPVRLGPAAGGARYCLMVDPIDGSRGLMYDKRSAWFLAVVAPDRGEETRLSDAVVSVLVELPTSKQGRADTFIAHNDRGWHVNAYRRDLKSGDRETLSPAPSTASTLRHGFAQVSAFFPGTLRLAADLAEDIAEATLGEVAVSEASLFNDQYISTGGQFVELATGRDRFTCDLRPLFFEILKRRGVDVTAGLCCHPYDIAGAPAAVAMGAILTDGFGERLDAPFDLETPIHWCGYANADLQAVIQPVIREWLTRNLA